MSIVTATTLTVVVTLQIVVITIQIGVITIQIVTTTIWFAEAILTKRLVEATKSFSPYILKRPFLYLTERNAIANPPPPKRLSNVCTTFK